MRAFASMAASRLAAPPGASRRWRGAAGCLAKSEGPGGIASGDGREDGAGMLGRWATAGSDPKGPMA